MSSDLSILLAEAGSLAEELRVSAIPELVAAEALTVADLDGNGDAEILAAGNAGTVVVLGLRD